MFMALLLSCKILGEGARALAAAADAREAGIALYAGGHHCVVCALTRSRESPEKVLQARRIWCLAWTVHNRVHRLAAFVKCMQWCTRASCGHICQICRLSRASQHMESRVCLGLCRALIGRKPSFDAMLRSRRWTSATRTGSACTRVRFSPSLQGFLGYVDQGACRIVWGWQRAGGDACTASWLLSRCALTDCLSCMRCRRRRTT